MHSLYQCYDIKTWENKKWRLCTLYARFVYKRSSSKARIRKVKGLIKYEDEDQWLKIPNETADFR